MSKDTAYFFVDESGDTSFFNRKGQNVVGKEGCSRILIIGLTKTFNPKNIRIPIYKLQHEIINDPYFYNVPSVKDINKRGFHATDDIPEVREKVFKLINSLKVKAEIIVSRKIEKIFREKHLCNENLFYDDIVSKLFEPKLHKSSKIQICFSIRGNRKRQKPLENAILKAKKNFEQKLNIQINSKINVFAQYPRDECCLQVIDYINWSVYRAYEKKDVRYVNYLLNNIRIIKDIYDFNKYPLNSYSRRKNKFDINKISPL